MPAVISLNFYALKHNNQKKRKKCAKMRIMGVTLSEENR